MKESAVENFERIRQAHSLIHNPEAAGNSPALVRLERNTIEDLLTVAENTIKTNLPNVVYLGSKKVIESQISDLSQNKENQAVYPITEKPSVNQYSTLSLYFKNLYLLAAEPEFSSEDKYVISLDSSAAETLKIDVLPPPLKINKFPSGIFLHHSPVEKNTELLWKSPNKKNLQRTMMDNQNANQRRAMILLDYGTHLFAYKTGNLICPPAPYAQRLRMQKTGIFAFYENTRPALVVQLINRSKKDVPIWLTSEENWLDDTYSLPPPLGGKCVALNLRTENLKPGINEAKVDLRCLSAKGMRKIKSFSVKVEQAVNGALPSLKCKLTNAQNDLSDKFGAKLTANISVEGIGSLSGLLLIPQIGQDADFRMGDVTQNSVFEHDFIIPPEKFALCESELKIILISDCFYANMRVQQETIPFRAIYLKKSLPSLFFGNLAPGRKYALQLVVRRSDGKEIYLEAVIPPNIEKYLKAFRRDNNSLSFHFDTQNLQPGTSIREIVRLTDANSGLQDNIKIIANVTDS